MKMSEDERAGLDILKARMPEDLATDLVKFRRTKKAPITARIARALLKEYEAFGDIEKAAETHMVRGWVGFDSAWIKKPQGFTDQNHPTPRISANYGAPKPANDEPASAAIDPERRRQLAELARQTARGMRAN